MPDRDGPVLIELEDTGPSPADVPAVTEGDLPTGQAMATMAALAARRPSRLAAREGQQVKRAVFVLTPLGEERHVLPIGGPAHRADRALAGDKRPGLARRPRDPKLGPGLTVLVHPRLPGYRTDNSHVASIRAKRNSTCRNHIRCNGIYGNLCIRYSVISQL